MEEIYRSQFRLPYSLYEKMKASADKNRRSVNAELIARLEESFSPRTLDDVQVAKSAELDREIARLTMEGANYSRAMNALMEKARAAAGTPDEDSLGAQILEVAEAFGKIEREKFQAMMRREMLD